MDAASLMEVIKSAAMMAAWLTSSVAMDDSPECPLKCKTQCESCATTATTEVTPSADTCPTATCPTASCKTGKATSEGCPLTAATCPAGATDGCPACPTACDSDRSAGCVSVEGYLKSSSPHAVIYLIRTSQSAASESDCTDCLTAQTLTASAMPVGASASLSDHCCEAEKKGEGIVLRKACQHRDGRVEATAPCGDCSTEKFVETNGVELLGRWMAGLISGKPKVTARVAVHSVAPEIDLPATEVGHKKICAGGKCYEVDEATVEGKTCDQPRVEETEEEEPIMAAPVPPPVPTSYQFTDNPAIGYGEVVAGRFLKTEDVGIEELCRSDATVPAGVFVRLMVEHVEAKTKLEMTQALMEERSAVMEHVMALMERNAQLQTQIAVMESRQHMSDAISASVAERLDAALRTPPQMESSEWTAEEAIADGRNQIDTIQEDLANIRRQIAIIKRNQPVPFAPSYVGTPAAATSNPWRTARVTPYVPIVAPLPVAKEVCTDPACTGSGCNK